MLIQNEASSAPPAPNLRRSLGKVLDYRDCASVHYGYFATLQANERGEQLATFVTDRAAEAHAQANEVTDRAADTVQETAKRVRQCSYFAKAVKPTLRMRLHIN